MDFNELRAFVVLARHKHFARAAAALHASPSALSRILSRLEEEMGSILLDRDTRELTEAGQFFLKFAEESLSRKDELHLVLGAADGILRGTLRVYASVTACYSLIPPLAEELRLAYPDLRLSVETGDPADAEQVVREGSVDLALSALPEGGFNGIQCFSVQRTPLVFAAAGEGVYGRLGSPAGNLKSSEIGSNPLILPSRGLARERFDRWARIHSLRPQIAAETAGNEAILALARLGIGLGLVPRIVLDNSPFSQGLVLYPTEKEFGDYDIGFLLSPVKRGSMGQALNQSLKTLLDKVYTKGRWV